jgi:hypothetical protein
MWICPGCKQKFVRDNQSHSCNEKTLSDFLNGKSEHTRMLFDYFITEFRSMGDFDLHPAKTMISFAAGIRFGRIHQLGKNFIDVCFYFDKAYEDNLCFHKIAQVPGEQQFNHYFRMYQPEDLNEEVRGYMQLALKNARKH